MKTEKNMMKNGMTSTEVLVGVIIPFVLFWGGMLSPLYTGDILVWICSLVPFYGYLFVCEFATEKTKEQVVGVPSVLNVVTSVLLLGVFFFIPEENGMIRNVCKMGIVNILPSITILFFVSTENFINNTSGESFIPYI